jgi:hypothetical protein
VPPPLAKAATPEPDKVLIADPSAKAGAPEPDEVLIADPRGRLSPAQMVDEKLLVLLRSGHPGLYCQASGRPQDIRQTPEGRARGQQ